MTVYEYLEECILSLTLSPVVKLFHVIKRRGFDTDGYLRVRAILTNEGLFEISLYCQPAGKAVRLIEYRFHWQNKEGKLIMRWDNAKHHPEVKTFPCHIHIGDDKNVKESAETDLFEAIRVLESEMREAENRNSK